MATFNENLETIENGVYGRDVRQAIHDAIEQNHAMLGTDITTAQVDAKFSRMYTCIVDGTISVLGSATVSGTTLILTEGNS